MSCFTLGPSNTNKEIKNVGGSKGRIMCPKAQHVIQ